MTLKYKRGEQNFRSGGGFGSGSGDGVGGVELEGKRKGHVCETGAVWYFSCQPEERKSHTYTHKHKAISPPPPASFHLYGASVVLAARACTDTHTEIDA